MQPIRALEELLRLDVPVILGTNSNEGSVFIFTACPARLNNLAYKAFVFSFFREAAAGVLRIYRQLENRVMQSAQPDYRLVLSEIIGDYLFRCPNLYVASLLHSVAGTPVFLYEFSLATRTPGEWSDIATELNQL